MFLVTNTKTLFSSLEIHHHNRICPAGIFLPGFAV